MTKLSRSFIIIPLIASAIIAVFILKSQLASATTYYVSSSGSASWNKCIKSNMPCSVTTAMKRARAGDTVIFLPGTYNLTCTTNYEVPVWNPSNSGTRSSPIIFRSSSRLGAIVKSSNPDSCGSPLIGSYSANYIVWDGFTLDTSNYSSSIGQGPVRFGNTVGGGSNCTLQNSDLIGHYSTVNDNYPAISTEHAKYLTIRNNRIHGFTDSNSGRGTAIIFFNMTGGVIENNEIYNNNGGINDKEQGTNNVYRYNFIHDNSSYSFDIMTQDRVNVDNIQIYQNIFARNGGVEVDADSPMTVTNVNWYNNTFYKDLGPAMGTAATTNNLGSAWNNIIVSSRQPFFSRGIGSPSYVDFNNYFDTKEKWVLHHRASVTKSYSSFSEWQKTGFDSHSLYANPHFINASGDYSSASDFKRKSYPHNGRGGSYAPIMGAYIKGDEIIGYLGSGSTSKIHPDPTVASGKHSAAECADWQSRHPEWIFCDDFEDTSALVRPGRYFEYDKASGRFVPEENVGYEGSRGMKAVWNKWDVGAGSLRISFGRNPGSGMNNAIATDKDFREIYYRLYMKLQDGWRGNPQKLSRATVITGPDWSQAMIAHLWGDTSTHLSMDPATCVIGERVRCSGYNDFGHLTWIDQRSGKTSIFDGKHNGKWFCIEAHVKLNDPGKSNGMQEFWIDGKQEAIKNGLNFVGSYTAYGINAVFIENYWNQGAPAQQERYIDNIVISTKPVGCLDH
jgi:hypothetical protein